jgi:hypothetical protein
MAMIARTFPWAFRATRSVQPLVVSAETMRAHRLAESDDPQP